MDKNNFMNPLDINSEQFRSDEKNKEQSNKPPKQLSFKVVKDVKRKPRGKTGRDEYTLDCERRLFHFKHELNAKL